MVANANAKLHPVRPLAEPTATSTATIARIRELAQRRYCVKMIRWQLATEKWPPFGRKWTNPLIEAIARVSKILIPKTPEILKGTNVFDEHRPTRKTVARSKQRGTKRGE